MQPLISVSEKKRPESLGWVTTLSKCQVISLHSKYDVVDFLSKAIQSKRSAFLSALYSFVQDSATICTLS